VSSRPRLVTPALLKRWPLPAAQEAEGKESRGRVLVVGGCSEVPGAVMLAGMAALRVGAGKLQLATVSEAAIAIGVAMPESLVMGLPAASGGNISRATPALRSAALRTDALLIGPGMRDGVATTRLVRALAQGDAALVLDAGALSAHAQAGNRVRVITPHAGEMAGLLGIGVDEVTTNAEALAREFAIASGVITVLKGATTFVASPDGTLWQHSGGTVGLGTSGSGDVLAGAIAGLLARGASGEQAAVWGVHLHGLAGSRLSQRHGLVGFLAREIAWELPAVLPD
jgi:ADP-dependent NAD(P)H-hydrate dehydratase